MICGLFADCSLYYFEAVLSITQAISENFMCQIFNNFHSVFQRRYLSTYDLKQKWKKYYRKIECIERQFTIKFKASDFVVVILQSC